MSLSEPVEQSVMAGGGRVTGPPPGGPPPAALAATGGDDSDKALELLRMMLDAVDLLAVAELERALRLKLSTPVDQAAERVARLGFLAELLERDGIMVGEPEDWPGVPIVPRRLFDELAPAHQVSSAALVELHGSWLKVCRAAYGLRPDGRHTGPGRPWITRRGVRNARFRWTRETCMGWLRRCALELGRNPTSDDYNRWRRELVRIPGNQAIRAPWAKSITEHCGGSWQSAINKLGVSEHELAQVRAERLPAVSPTPLPIADRLAALGAEDLSRLGLTTSQARKLRGAKARGALAFTSALDLADALGGSLDWLAGRSDEPGTTPDLAAAFDGVRVKLLRERLDISEKTLREAAGLALGDWRKLLAGKTEPTLGQLAGMASALRVPVDELAPAP